MNHKIMGDSMPLVTTEQMINRHPMYAEHSDIFDEGKFTPACREKATSDDSFLEILNNSYVSKLVDQKGYSEIHAKKILNETLEILRGNA